MQAAAIIAIKKTGNRISLNVAPIKRTTAAVAMLQIASVYFSDHFNITKVALLFAEVISITPMADRHIEVDTHKSHASEGGSAKL